MSWGAIARFGLGYLLATKPALSGRPGLPSNNGRGRQCSPGSRCNNRSARCGPSGCRLPSPRASTPVKSRFSVFVSCERQLDEKCPWPAHLRGVEARLRINRKVADAVLPLVAGLSPRSQMAGMRTSKSPGRLRVGRNPHARRSADRRWPTCRYAVGYSVWKEDRGRPARAGCGNVLFG